MKNRIVAVLLSLVIAAPYIANAQDPRQNDPDKSSTNSNEKQTGQTSRNHKKDGEASKKVSEATQVVTDFANMTEGPPKGLLEKAAAVIVVPNLVKAGFIAGAKHGAGVLSVRDESGNWNEPVFVNLTGGSIGFQAGVSSTDLVLLLMRERDVTKILDGEFTLGGEATVAVGPLGRQGSAETDINFDAPIYSYSRSKGAFAGISVDGSKISQDKKSNESVYGQGYDSHEIIEKAPESSSPGAEFAQALEQLTGKETSTVRTGSN